MARDLFKEAGIAAKAPAADLISGIRKKYMVPKFVTDENVIDEAIRISGQPRNEFMVRNNLVQTGPTGPGLAEGVPRAFGQGAVMNFGDELTGAGAATRALLSGGSPSEAYSQATAESRNRADQFSESNPVASTAAHVGGAVAGSLPLMGLGVPATLFGRVKQGAGIGAGMGLTAGVGAGEGAGDSAVKGAAGVGVGGILGGALPVATNAVSAGARNLGNMLGWRNSGTVANEKVAAAIARDNMTPQQLLSKVDDARSAGVKPEILPDFGGENLRSVARTAAMRPGEGRDLAVGTLQGRQVGQAGRIEKDVLSNLSGNARLPVKTITDAQKKLAGPLYDKAYAAHRELSSDALEGMLNRPAVRAGIKRAYATAEERGIDPRTLGFAKDKDGNVILTKKPSLETWDHIKRGVDEELDSFKDVFGKIRGERGSAINDTRVELLDELKAAAPEYAKALEAWAGPARTKELFQAGRAAMTEDAELTTREIAKLSPGDRTMFQAGIARTIRDLAARADDGADSVRRVFGNKLFRERIQAAFPDGDDFANFEMAMKREARMFQTNRTLDPTKGSETVLRQADMAAAAPSPVMEGLTSFAQGGGAKAALLQALGADRAVSRMGGYTQEVSDQLAKMLYSTDPTRQQEALRGILSMQLRQQPSLQRGLGVRQGILGGAAGVGFSP